MNEGWYDEYIKVLENVKPAEFEFSIKPLSDKFPDILWIDYTINGEKKFHSLHKKALFAQIEALARVQKQSRVTSSE